MSMPAVSDNPTVNGTLRDDAAQRRLLLRWGFGYYMQKKEKLCHLDG